MSENTQKIHIRNKNQINEIDLWGNEKMVATW